MFIFIKMKLIIINGPNLNLLGIREEGIYGSKSFDAFFSELLKKYPEVQIEHYQSNVEGDLIDKLHKVGFSYDGIIMNAGGYTHTSVALADAVAAIKTPTIEVHISNVFAREDYRHVSYLGKHCKGSISGFGLKGYEMAIDYYLNIKK
jgi:3-dehydroquinate dehydratase II